MRIQLARKLADRIDDVDLTHCHAGDVIDLPAGDALLLIAEGWAVLTDAPITCEARAEPSNRAARPRRQPSKRTA